MGLTGDGGEIVLNVRFGPLLAAGIHRDVQLDVPKHSLQLLRSALSRIGTERRTSGKYMSHTLFDRIDHNTRLAGDLHVRRRAHDEIQYLDLAGSANVVDTGRQTGQAEKENPMTELRFGVALIPTLDLETTRRLAVVAEQAGLEYIGVQDHPYAPQYLDAFVVIGDLLARTERIQLFPDVANLPLRPPSVLARTASALSQVSGGRFQLGLGAGGYRDAIESMGAPRRTSPEALRALDEAITIMRGLWRADSSVDHDGEFYRVRGIGGQQPGPGGVEIWVGAQGPRSLVLTGRVADGWAAPIPAYLPYDRWAESNEVLNRAARDAGRDPAGIRRVAQLVGTIETATPASRPLAQSGADPVRADVAGWVELLTRLATEQPFTTFVLWPEQADEQQIRLFAEEVAPGVRERMGERSVV
ncbi:LLM class flavin-dependent oxidoreductase [Pseudonocardia sp. CA-142604]|uniref:LLM class flavin-dependent oxidoreductase n=1 Tax=Pseudonocardia sp. CA-142604 TaxID=3240024 RepID=UPI003D919171